ncbi:MAG: hypothetical protein HQK56_16255 [Deltaproteobacteria bacterium]|nr:hypothetical protein [Deltaproteobacteria bacterium]
MTIFPCKFREIKCLVGKEEDRYLRGVHRQHFGVVCTNPELMCEKTKEHPEVSFNSDYAVIDNIMVCHCCPGRGE